MEIVFMLVMGVLVVGGMAGALAAMALSGIRTGQWPVLRRRRVIWRGFVVR
ncbi:hypothetical protein [Nonomuraea sp. NPDC050310]|uniref:hypothetical protein n=1 Tax=unclassified Nonomuraea TaxID=2593643 RepID=UPI0033F47EEF